MRVFFNYIKVLFIFFSTVFSAVLAAIVVLFSSKLSFWVARNIWAKSVCFFARCKVKVSVTEALDNFDQPAIYCCNHLSSFDIIAMYISLEKPIYFIAKKEIKKIPFLGWYMIAAGMIFLDRSNREKAMRSMRDAGREIKKGKNIISFPEGTRSKNGKIRLFKRGSFIIAKEGGIPIIPVAISGSDKVNPNGTLQLNKGIIHTKIGSPLYCNANETAESFAERTRNQVEYLLKEI